jgi:hypothetical protein
MIGMPADGAAYVPRESVLQDILQTYALLNPTARAQAQANLAQTQAGTGQTKAATGQINAQTAEIPDVAARNWADTGIMQQNADTEAARNALTQKQIEQTGQLESRHLDIADAMNKITAQFQQAELAERQRAAKVAEGQKNTELGYEGATVGSNVARAGADLGESAARTGLINKQTDMFGVQQIMGLLPSLIYSQDPNRIALGAALTNEAIGKLAPQMGATMTAKAQQDEAARQALIGKLSSGAPTEGASAASGIENFLLNATPVTGAIRSYQRGASPSGMSVLDQLRQSLTGGTSWQPSGANGLPSIPLTPASRAPTQVAPPSVPSRGSQPITNDPRLRGAPTQATPLSNPTPGSSPADDNLALPTVSGGPAQPSIFDYLFGGATPDNSNTSPANPPFADPNLYTGLPPKKGTPVVKSAPNFLATGLPSLQ